MEPILLSGQTAVVTGGSRGIGREIAQALANAGAKVAVTARNQELLAETVQLIESKGQQCAAFVMDVTQPDEVQEAMQAITAHFGPIDILVNNAGLGGGGTLPWESDIDDWWRIIEVNVRGVYLCCHAVMPSMIERKSGRVINIGSNAGNHPNPMSSAYAVSKAALLRLTDSLAAAAEDANVSVFAISPGLVLTDMTRDVPHFKDIPASDWTDIQVAGEMVVLLASGQADKLTGRFIHVREDDIHDLINKAEDIVANDLHTLRLNK